MDLGDPQQTSRNKSAETFAKLLRNAARQLDLAIVPKTLLSKDSSNIVPDDWDAIITTISHEYDAYDAFLITHGTNTLGYTSAALSFALGNLGKPVVLTGAQVPYGETGSDAVMNLENAARVASQRERLAGVVAVFGSHIITGVRVKKRTEFAYDAFTTFGSENSLGRIGRELSWNQVLLDRHNSFMNPTAEKARQLDVKASFEMDLVSLTEFPGLSSRFFKVLVDSGVKGILYRAAGAGDPNVAPKNVRFANLREGFEYLRAKKIPIVVTTQAAEGVASMDVNEPGKLASELGAIAAWDMSLEAMTVKLAWLLGRGFSYDEIRSSMLKSFRGEIDPVRSQRPGTGEA
jgi:L-asparaginase